MRFFEAYERCKKVESKPEPKDNTLKYSQNEICPACGRYSVDGSVCILCQKDYDLYVPKITYIDI